VKDPPKSADALSNIFANTSSTFSHPAQQNMRMPPDVSSLWRQQLTTNEMGVIRSRLRQQVLINMIFYTKIIPSHVLTEQLKPVVVCCLEKVPVISRGLRRPPKSAKISSLLANGPRRRSECLALYTRARKLQPAITQANEPLPAGKPTQAHSVRCLCARPNMKVRGACEWRQKFWR